MTDKIDLRPMNADELALYEKAVRRLRGKVGKQIRQKQDNGKKRNRKSVNDVIQG